MAVTTPSSLVRGFADLFAGRVDVYGSGTGTGGCVKLPLTYHQYEAHLRDVRDAIGVYPQRDNGKVKWGCSDIDVPDYGLAYNLHAALNTLGIRSHIELTRSRNYHVWVFAVSWVLAATMRRAFLVAHDLAGIAAREVNPKQETLEGQSYGNYVRLPYPGALNDTFVRQVIVAPQLDSWVPLDLNEFLHRAYARLTPESALEHAASLYRPEPVKEVLFDGLPPVNKELTTRLNGLTWTVFQDGPLEGDRSAALFKLAAGCRDSGLTPSEALVIVTDADVRWGKYSVRPDGARWLRTTVERAYQ